jgi:hypothetical protein
VRQRSAAYALLVLLGCTSPTWANPVHGHGAAALAPLVAAHSADASQATLARFRAAADRALLGYSRDHLHALQTAACEDTTPTTIQTLPPAPSSLTLGLTAFAGLGLYQISRAVPASCASPRGPPIRKRLC